LHNFRPIENLCGDPSIITMTEETEKTSESSSAEAKPSDVKSEAVESEVLRNLVILPPKQIDGTFSRNEVLDAVPLPPIRAEEPVASIRAALSEVCGYGHLTNYRFVLEKPLESKAAGNPNPPTISPYTGKNAVVSVPIAVKSLEREPQVSQEAAKTLALDDYGDLLPLIECGLQDGSAFRVVLERYDVALIRDHVNRLRSLLDGNAPSATSLDESAEAKDKSASNETSDDTGDAEKPSPETQPANEDPGTELAEKGKEKAEETRTPPKDMPVYKEDKPVTQDSENLKDFFYLACGEDPALYLEDIKDMPGPKKENGKSKKKGKKGKDTASGDDEKGEPSTEQFIRGTIPRLNMLEEKTRIKCTIRFSGYHPPPPFRRLVGDLSYLEVTPPGESEAIHITAIPTGFYVNRSSSKDGFDPSPAEQPCFSHELLDCLLQCSASVESAWADALAASKERAQLMTKLNEEGPYASLFRVAIRGDFSGYDRPSTASASEGIDALIQNPSWLVPVPKVAAESKDSWKRNYEHAYNPTKTEDDLSNSFGVDIRSGTVRDWNEELQSAREMPTLILQERIERAR
jgi:protein TIF31